MLPVKEMALAELVDVAMAERTERVEQTVGNVDGPDAESLQNGNPRRQVDSGAPRKSQRPDDGDRGSIETGKMPEVKRS